MALHTHVFGPTATAPEQTETPERIGTPERTGSPLRASGRDEQPIIVALHGLTGHGRRWESLATEHLSDLQVVAPDLLGHGYSPYEPPWTMDDHLTALTDVVDRLIVSAGRSLVIVGHSFGAALAIRLAHRLQRESDPHLLKGLVLLDPAQGLDPSRALSAATESLANWWYPDAAAARAAKRAAGWSKVSDQLMDKEIRDHLVTGPEGVTWRVCAPAAATAWSEMTRPAVLPPNNLPTTVVVADRVDPPFVTESFLAGCAGFPEVDIVHADCEHMVQQAEPELTARLVRSMIGRDHGTQAG